MEVSVSDGRHMVFTTATVAVFSLDGEAARDPLTLRFTDISIAQFEDVSESKRSPILTQQTPILYF